MTAEEVAAGFDALAPRIERLRALVAGADPAAYRGEADPVAGSVDDELTRIAKALNEAERKGAAGNAAAMMTLAARQRAAGAPHPLLGQWCAADQADASKAEEHRRQFDYWLTTVEDFRRRALARAAAL